MKNNKEYKVIWFDDEYETLEEIIESAEENNIKLFPFDNESQGVEHLKLNKGFYDAILTDAIFYTDTNKNDDLEGKSGDTALLNLLRSIDQMKVNDPLPVFILSGKTSFKENEHNIGIRYGVDIFDKLDNDIENRNQMWTQIKNEIDKQPIQELKLKYSRVFKITDEKYLGYKSYSSLLEIVNLLEDNKEYTQTKDDFISIRKFTEIIIDKLFDLNLIPLEFKGSHNRIIRFICSEQTHYFHPTLSFIFRNMNELLQDSSHSKNELMYKVDEYSLETKSPYILKSLIFQLFDVLIWLKDFIDQHPTKNENSKKLKPYYENRILGVVINKHFNGHAYFKPNYSYQTAYIKKDLVDEKHLKENDKIQVEINYTVRKIL